MERLTMKNGIHRKGVQKVDYPRSYKTLGEAVKGERIRAEIGLRELARETGIAASTVCRIEKNQANPRISTVIKIAKALHIPADVFINM